MSDNPVHYDTHFTKYPMRATRNGFIGYLPTLNMLQLATWCATLATAKAFSVQKSAVSTGDIPPLLKMGGDPWKNDDSDFVQQDHHCSPLKASSSRDTFLWTISEQHTGRTRGHFFGTIHVPYTQVWDTVAPEAKRAFGMANAVFVELDLADRETLSKLARCQLLPAGEHVRDYMPAALFDRKAAALSKKVGAVEGAQEQCDPLNKLNHSLVIFILNHTLSEAENDYYSDGNLGGRHRRDSLLHHYKCGSLDENIFAQSTLSKLVASTSGSLQQEKNRRKQAAKVDAYFRDELIRKRNIRMANRALELIRNDPQSNYFFAFGAGHFLGSDSIVELFREAGFNVHKVKRHDDRKTYNSASLALAPKRRQKHTVAHLWQRIDTGAPKSTDSQSASSELQRARAKVGGVRWGRGQPLQRLSQPGAEYFGREIERLSHRPHADWQSAKIHPQSFSYYYVVPSGARSFYRNIGATLGIVQFVALLFSCRFWLLGT